MHRILEKRHKDIEWWDSLSDHEREEYLAWDFRRQQRLNDLFKKEKVNEFLLAAQVLMIQEGF